MADQLIRPIESASVVTTSDSTNLTNVTRGLYVGVAGDVKVTLSSGNVITIKNLAAGVVHPFRVSRVWATGTTATDIVGCY